MESAEEHMKLLLYDAFEKGNSIEDAITNVCNIYGVGCISEDDAQHCYKIFRKHHIQSQWKCIRTLLASDPKANVRKVAKELKLSHLAVQVYLKNCNSMGNLEASDTALPSTDEEDECLEDQDTCNSFELEQNFKIKYRISDESAVTLKKDYVLSLCQDGGFTRLAAGLSNGEVQIFDINGERSLIHASLESIAPITANNNNNQPANVCGVQFLDDSSADCLLVGTTNGLVRLYDLRSQRVEARFEQDEANTTAAAAGGLKGIANITCFERNANSRILCTGTEQYQKTDVYLIFYDIRQRRQLGGYCESHQDDITSIRFHARNPDLMCSGSTDGLINIFNLKETNEDDALMTTINTESSVHKLNWHKNVYEKDTLSCITHTNDFKAYDCDEGDLIVEFERDKIYANMKRKNPANCNLINAHNMEDGGVFLVAGTNFKRGEILRTLVLQNKELLPLADFDGNKQIIRESVYNAKNRALITAGESGIITLWTAENFGHSNPSSNKLKSKTRLNSSKKNPY